MQNFHVFSSFFVRVTSISAQNVFAKNALVSVVKIDAMKAVVNLGS